MLVVSGLLLAPPAVLFWLLSHPSQNLEVLVTTDHFIIVTNVSVVATVVAMLVARAASTGNRTGMLLVALGFATLAGLFAVHGLATPGILLPDESYVFGGSVIGVSAYLSLFVPSLFFAARYVPPAGSWIERRFARAGMLPIIVLGGLVAYAALSIGFAEIVEAVPLSVPPLSFAIASATLLFLGFCTWRQIILYGRHHFPFQGALVISFVLLAESQISMLLAPIWTLAWWEYHALMLGAVIVAMAALILELDRRRGMERFLPATAIDKVMSGTMSWPRERRTVTVLFADLRDSTVLAERLDPEAMMDMLNVYLGAVARAIATQGGTVDKFLGDGLMAIFGLLGDHSDGAAPAARAALEMRRSITLLNEQRVAQGETPIGFGLGIHTGQVLVGPMGLADRADYTAIGDAVNTAARLQELSKQYGVDIVLSEESATRLHPDWFSVRNLGEAPVRGKAKPVAICTLELAAGESEVAVDILSQVALFRDLDARDLGFISKVAVPRIYNDGSIIVREGATGEAFFVILSGKADVVKGLSESESVVLQTLSAGDYFGEMALFEDYVRSASVVARGPVYCLAFARANFMGTLQRSPELSIKLLRGISKRLRETDSRITV